MSPGVNLECIYMITILLKTLGVRAVAITHCKIHDSY